MAKLLFSYRTSLFNDSVTSWTYGTPINVRANNAFSPINATHQPYGWDQMAGLYRFYKVIGCEMSFKVANQTSGPLYFAVRPVPVNENATLSTDVATAAERPATITKQVAALGGPLTEMSIKLDIPKLLGVSKEQFDADVSEYSAATTAAPSRYAYVQAAVAGVNNTAYAEVLVDVVYTVHFWQRITQAQS